MKRITCLLAALLLTCGLSWAQSTLNIEAYASANGWSNGTQYLTATVDDVTFTATGGGNTGKYYTNGQSWRFYQNENATLTISVPDGSSLSSIIPTFTVTNNGALLYDSEVVNSEDAISVSGTSVTFSVGNTGTATNGQIRFTQIVVNYTTGGGTPAPSITASNVEITYDATEGAIGYTITNGVDGGVLSAATEAEWLTIGTVGETVPFTCTVNDDGERVATVTLTYTYNTDQTVTKNVTVTQANNPNAPGTENNPYTVAQARAAIDAGTGTQGVYATGIVSAIPTAYNSNYGNVTFNMVDEEGDEVFLQAYRCGGDEAANVTIGDVVVVYGNLTKYGSTYEFGQGCQVVSLTHPVITDPTITIDPAVVNVDADEHDGTLAITYANLTINNMEDFDVQYYNTEGQEANEPDWIEVLVAEQDPAIGEGYVVSYYMIANDGEARTAYFKVYAMDDETNLVYSNLVTINQAEYVVPALDYAELPFAFNGGRDDIASTDGLTQEGLGSDYNTDNTKLRFDGTGDWMLLHFNEAPGTLTFDIKGNSFSGGTFTVQTSEDGETYEDLVAYIELGGVETKTFDNLDENIRYIKWIYTEKSNGNVGLGNIHLYEVGGGPVPEPSVTVTPAIVNATAEGGNGNLIVNCENMSDNLNISVWTCDATGESYVEYDWFETVVDANVIDYTIEANTVEEARTAYLKIMVTDNEAMETYSSDVVTINQAAYVAPALDYAELPFEFDGGRADIENTDGLTQEGLGSDYGSSPKLKFDGTGDWLLLHFEGTPGELAFDIKGNGFSDGTFTVQTSEDGEEYTDFATFTELAATEHMTYNTLGENVRYIKWIYTEKVNGNVALGNITLAEPAAPVPSITFTPDVFNFDAEQHVLQIPFTYENIEVTNYQSFTTHFYDAEGEEIQLVQGEAWYYCSVTGIINGEGYQLTGVVIANEGEARSAYIKVSALDAAGETVYSNLVTVNQAAPVVPPVPGEWVMTRLADLTEDDVFVIVGVYDVDESSFAMPNNSTGAPSAVEVTMVGNTLSGDIDDNLKWNLSIGEDGYTFYPDGETETWLYCTNTNNGVRVGTNENNVFSMTSEGYLFNNATERYIGIYNGQDWRCYTSINNNIKEQTFAFYKRVDGSEIETYTLDITGYGNSDGGYYLIASPVSMIRPTTDNGFLTEEYDLYYYDQTQQDYEWRNYEAKHFNIASGKGYLYASQENTTLTFTGIRYNGNGEVALDYVGDTTWNLIGNPYSYYATVNRDFYVLNAAGSELELSETSQVNPMQGIFVEAVEADETVSFVEESGGVVGEFMLNLRVSNGNGNGDFARIRFGEGRTLSKFMLNENNTKFYFTQGGNDYAVVRSEAEGVMPVNFKASENGTYTLSVNPENMEMEYLHLIDNMTGTDVDLLASPNYSFEANVSDNAARFTLVFASLTGIEENNTNNFAFFSNGSFIISNEGKATLQVIDVNGHILKSESINGCVNVNVNAAPGVYMLRLVNGDNVRVQKVVVR